MPGNPTIGTRGQRSILVRRQVLEPELIYNRFRRRTFVMTRRISPDDLPWLEPAAGIRCQAVERNGRQIRFVEFALGFCETEWCPKAHLGYVVAGRMEIEFADAVEMFSTGDALMIAANDMHRARVVDGPVRLFLVEDV
jgi:hypothetical protein